jgi:N-acetylneuraminate synthase
MTSLMIGPKEFSERHPLIISEIGQAHDGSLGMAHAYIDAVADSSVDAIKFQTHIADAESTPGEPWRVKFSQQDKTRYDYWKRMEFTKEQWQGLKTHADDRGILFLSTPFSVEAVELLSSIGIPAWKVASGEVSNLPMLKHMAISRIPFLISTGMSSLDEIDSAVSTVQSKGLPFALFQCTSMYPCPPERLGLNMIPFFQDRYNCLVGISDHSGTIYSGLAATALGAGAVEVHVVFSRDVFGPDVSSSITIQELKQLVEGIRFIEKIRSNPVEKDNVADELAAVRDLFTKSIVLQTNVQAGTILQNEHLTFKKPGTGIPAKDIDQILGKRLVRNMKKDEMLKLSDIEKNV